MPYESNNVPHSIPGGVVTFYRAGISLGARVIESFTPSSEAVFIQREGAYGGAGGFSIPDSPNPGVDPAQKQQMGNTEVQVPSTSAEFIHLQDYFDITYGGESSRWVVIERSEPFKIADAWKQSIKVARDHYAGI